MHLVYLHVYILLAFIVNKRNVQMEAHDIRKAGKLIIGRPMHMYMYTIGTQIVVRNLT